MQVDDLLRDDRKLDVGGLRVAAQDVERAIAVDLEALHQDALRLTEQVATVRGDLEVEAHFEDDKFVMRDHDSITLFTDGVTEARRGADWYGDERLSQIVSTLPDSRNVPREVLLDVMQFQGPAARDDIAILSAIATSARGDS